MSEVFWSDLTELLFFSCRRLAGPRSGEGCRGSIPDRGWNGGRAPSDEAPVRRLHVFQVRAVLGGGDGGVSPCQGALGRSPFRAHKELKST